MEIVWGFQTEKREFKRREEDVLSAAFDLFSEKGVESVTIDMIAEKAEVGKGTIYKHFTSKNEIFGCLIIRQSKEILSTFSSIDTNTPLIAQIKQILRLFWDLHISDMRKFVVQHPKMILIFFAGLSIYAGFLLPGLTKDPSPYLLPVTHESRVNLEKLRENYTGSNDSILILLEAEETVFNYRTLTRIKQLTQAFDFSTAAAVV